MAVPLVCGVAKKVMPILGSQWGLLGISTSAACCVKGVPLGKMPNEDIDASNLDSLEKYRSYHRYLKAVEEESGRPHWWKTYRDYITQGKGHTDVVDISLPFSRGARGREVKERRKVLKENHRSSEMERAARRRTLHVPLPDMKAEWEKTNGRYHIRRIAEHYGIYKDLLQGAHFLPHVPIEIEYSSGKAAGRVPVHHGNVVTPTEAGSPPRVNFEAEEGSLWTLLLTNPDGHLQDNESEYLHWLVGNIPGNAVKSGEEICHYIPPFPAKGTGYHRFIFILFKQDNRIDFNEDSRPSPCHSLETRTFQTLDFYRRHQDAMTPAGLAFFQCLWDDSVTNTFHQILHMKEPVFEYHRPPVYHPPQKKFPQGQPLRYLDRYRNSTEPTHTIY
ncbi:39S ribosomal protein L38, mitochondrial [Erpetoichthys calabaricus]|uniref:Large ribosomal subunit protein mL38 n=1 Tax=Erpetoichthys calabaricus TaxID=27687 RepID=A0A8C4TQJ7_ERPCA|nr:39S ribosomal protein L38, mitochondrial [Erpetoichthys calabaricus]